MSDLEDKLRAEHGEVWEVTCDGQPIYIRCPDRALFKRFKAHASDAKKQSDADDMLAREVVVHPDRETFAALLERRPGVTLKIAAVAVDLAMGDEALGAKKVGKTSQRSAAET